MITLRPRIVMKKTIQPPLGRMAHERLVHLLYASWSAGRLPRHLVQFSGDLFDGDHEVAHVGRSDVTVPLVEEGVERPTASYGFVTAALLTSVVAISAVLAARWRRRGSRSVTRSRSSSRMSQA
jgi:hypothetical protein